MVKSGCDQFDGRTLKLTISEERTDGINCFLHAIKNSGKLNVDSMIFGWPWFFSS